MRGIHRALLLSFLFGTTSPALSSEIDVTPKLDAAESLAIDARLYAQAYGVNEAEAARRLLIMHGINDEIAKLEGEFGSSLSGIYFDNGADFGLKVRLKQDNAPPDRVLVRRAEREQLRATDQAARAAAQADRRALRSRAGISDEQVTRARSLIERDVSAKIAFEPKAPRTRKERQSEIDEKRSALKQGLPSFEMVVDDEQNDSAIVYVRDADASTQKLAEEMLGLPVRIVEIPTGIQSAHTRGGAVLERAADGVHNCMTAFVARKLTDDKSLGVLTAGHCFDPGDPAQNYTDRDGSDYPIAVAPKMYRNDTQFDLAFLQASHINTNNEFYGDPTGAARYLSATKSRTGTAVKSGTVKGSYICHLGQTTKTDRTLIQTCGEVTSINAANHSGGSTYVVVTNTQSGAGTTHSTGVGTLRCVRGDSGGPWFAYTTGYGVMSSCAWTNDTETVATIAVYTSLDYVQFLGGGASVSLQ